MESSEFYAITSWASAIFEFLEFEGISREELLRLTLIEPKALNKKDSIPVSLTTLVWEYAYDKYGPGIGLKVANYSGLRNWSILGLALQSSTNINEFLQRFSKYHTLISDAVDVRYESSELGSKKLATHFIQPVKYQDERTEAYMASILKLMKSMMPRKLSPIAQVDLIRSQPSDPKLWFEVFGKNICWNMPEMAFHFSDNSLQEPFLYADLQFSEVIEQNLLYRLELKNINSFSEKVKKELLLLLTKGKPTIKIVASNLNMSPRSLQRRLLEEGLTFGALTESLQLKLAKEYLKYSNKNLYEISILLGFSNQSNFSNAFKKWTGISPDKYRKTIEDKTL